MENYFRSRSSKAQTQKNHIQTIYSPLLLSNNNVSQVNSQKDLGVILAVKSTFEEHLKNVSNKTNKTIGLLQNLFNLLPRQSLITIYKAFVRPHHLDYGDVL